MQLLPIVKQITRQASMFFRAAIFSICSAFSAKGVGSLTADARIGAIVRILHAEGGCRRGDGKVAGGL